MLMLTSASPTVTVSPPRRILRDHRTRILTMIFDASSAIPTDDPLVKRYAETLWDAQRALADVWLRRIDMFDSADLDAELQMAMTLLRDAFGDPRERWRA